MSIIQYCHDIAFLCRVRYEVFSRDIDNFEGIQEQIDLGLFRVIERMKADFQLHTPEAMFVFDKFFWTYLEDAEDWIYAKSVFGRDFEHTKDTLKEYLESV